MNIFVLVTLVILACLACIGLALWYRKRMRKLDNPDENQKVLTDFQNNKGDQAFDPGRYD